MGAGSKFSKMEIGILEITLMEWQMGMDNTFGQMEASIREILNTV